MKRASYTKKGFRAPWAVGLMAVLCVLAGYFLQDTDHTVQAVSANSTAVHEKAASVYFLDVGQGDSELICLPDGKNILIDAGTTATAGDLVTYLQGLGIKKLDAVIGTHPHEDHIGGMTQVVKNFEIGKIYLPKVADKQTPTTRTYENLLDAVAQKKQKLTQGKAGMTILEEGDSKLEFVAPNGTSYKGLNDYSIVAKFTFGEKSFLFTGDAEIPSEKEMCGAGYNLHADVLKCGHHGSSTSTSAAFLKAVSPKYAILSCGVNNDYGHPHHAVVTRLEKAGVQIYRTDKDGTIRALCDGKSIVFETGMRSLVK